MLRAKAIELKATENPRSIITFVYTVYNNTAITKIRTFLHNILLSYITLQN